MGYEKNAKFMRAKCEKESERERRKRVREKENEVLLVSRESDGSWFILPEFIMNFNFDIHWIKTGIIVKLNSGLPLSTEVSSVLDNRNKGFLSYFLFSPCLQPS